MGTKLMIREEIIKNAAHEYIITDKTCGVGVRTQAFIDGAKWADEHPASPWHDVKEELPNVNAPVLVLTYSGNVVTTSMRIPRDINGNILGDKEWKGNYAFKRSITHWMEIPKLPTE